MHVDSGLVNFCNAMGDKTSILSGIRERFWKNFWGQNEVGKEEHEDRDIT